MEMNRELNTLWDGAYFPETQPPTQVNERVLKQNTINGTPEVTEGFKPYSRGLANTDPRAVSPLPCSVIEVQRQIRRKRWAVN